MIINRRNFIKNTAIAAAGMAISNPLFAKSQTLKKVAKTSPVTNEKVVVVVNLFGGNDGLNTVIPVNPSQYDTYLQLRSNIAYDQAQLLTLNGEPDFTLNPGMTGFQNLFNNGRLAIINGVSVPEEAVGLFDHESGQYEFQSCDIIRNLAAGPSSGWLGRYLDIVPDPQPGQIFPGIDFGGGRLMLTGLVRTPVSISSIDNFQLQVNYDEAARRQAYQNTMNIPNSNGGVAELNRNYRVQALDQSQIIQNATAGYVPSVTYPDTYLGFQLQECAKIITGDIGARCLAVGTGGFDTHSGQNQVFGGLPYHEYLLKDVSDSISAFYQDMINQGHSQRVLILTISEFGRRGYSNNDDGTDHGFASIAFATGDMVNGGLYGYYPDLNNLVLDGSLAITNDFRSFYATVLGTFLQVDPQPIVDPNNAYPDFPLLGFL